MKIRLPLTLAITAMLLYSLSAQQQRSCGTVDYNIQIEKDYPEVKEAREVIEKSISSSITVSSASINSSGRSVIIIPVVVHILYHPNLLSQNLSHNRVVEQINVLNQDFRANNPDTSLVPVLFKGLVVDAEIQFCLAARDPQGNWTDGITRTQTTQTSFSMGDDAIIKSTAQGGRDAWDRDKYLNIWVCNLSGNVLGYTQLPGGPANLDGLVIGYKYFGKTGASSPYHKGRTTTHEVGHWLNLFHVWGDDNGACWGSDYCDDTPNQAADNYACPSFPHPSCGNTSDMYMNYMDYVDDACMFMFTPDQKARMLAVLNGVRSGILSSDGCVPAVGVQDAANIRYCDVFPIPASGQLNVKVSLNQPAILSVVLVDELGRECFSLLTPSQSEHSLIVPMEALPVGLYILKIEGAGVLETRKIPHYN